MTLLKRAGTLTFALVLGLSVVNTAGAQSVAEFYKGKRMTMMVGSGTGGSYNAYARTLARHIGKHIPGNPSFVVQNMPGAGGVKMTTFLYNKAVRDGSVIAAVQSTTPLDPLLFKGKYQYDATKFTWLGSLDVVTNVMITWHTKKIKNLNDLLTKNVSLAAVGSRTDGVVFSRLLNKWLGGNIKIVGGYGGSGEMFLAMERGEVDGRGGVPWATVKARKSAWIKDKKIDVPLQLAPQRDPELPNSDNLLDHVKDPAQKKAFEMLFSRQEMGRPYFAPPGIPADRVKALRAAFVATANDPAFRADLKKQKFALVMRTGKQVEAIIKRAYSTDKKTIAMLRKGVAAPKKN